MILSKFESENDLSNLIDLLQPAIEQTNWFFVVLDSARQDFSATKAFLSPEMEQNKIHFWWDVAGLWLAGTELTKAYTLSRVVVPFSAAFIFDREVKYCPIPNFSLTTDMGAFTEREIDDVRGEILRIGAFGYAADGVGLQYFFVDERFDSLLPK